MPLKSQVQLHPDTKEVLISINDFSMKFDSEESLFYLLEVLSSRRIGFKDSFDQSINIDANGDLIIHIWDRWVNPESFYGDKICHTHDLATTLVDYLLEQWKKS